MKHLFALLTVMLLSSCSNNKVIGTWVFDSSNQYSDNSVSMNMGAVYYTTFKWNGDFENVMEASFGASGTTSESKGGSLMKSVVKGTWEMPDGSKIIVHTKTASLFGGKEMENIGEIVYNIISINDDELIVMTKGEKMKYKRKD
ncbi:MAG: hypothetical protein IJJ56_06955 [Prevotella sp.]|nr:hypothetical protein [Prevotella sp.]